MTVMRNFAGIILLAFLLGVFIALIILQIKLSRTESRWPGIILPAIFSLLAVFLCVSVMLYNVVDVGTVVTQSYDPATDTYITTTEPVTVSNEAVSFSIAGALVSSFGALLPAVVFFVIYLICRSSLKSKRDKQLELDKMSISDLA